MPHWVVRIPTPSYFESTGNIKDIPTVGLTGEDVVRIQVQTIQIAVAAFGAIMLIAPGSAQAQLTPWGGNPSVLVDTSVLGDRIAPPGSGRLGSGSPLLGGNRNPAGLLEPPAVMPRSRLLIPSAPGTTTTARQPNTAPPAASKLTLIPPAELRRRGVKTAAPAAPKAAPRKRVVASAPAKPKPPKVAVAKSATPPKAAAMPKVVAPKPPTPPKAVPPKVAAPKAPPRPAVTASAAPPPPAISAPAPASKPKGEAAAAKITQQASRDAGKDSAATSSITFGTNLASVNAAAKAQLDKIAQQLSSSDTQRLQLLAYAGEANLPPSKARRLSLSRALAVRTYLIEKGVRRTRIDVRALGNKVPEGPPSRVDVRLTNP